MGQVGAIPSTSARFGRRAERLFTALLIVLAALLFPARSLAKEHPVPLDKNTDSATCIGCHEDKTKGKAVHSAIAMGCTSCHEVRSNKTNTHVKLITTTTGALCLTCHADKNAADLKGRVHPPAVRECTSCHDPHTSDNKNQLLKPVSGGAGENLCLNCHSIGIKVAPKGSRHAALDMGCDTCHTTHKVGDPEKHEFKYHLVKETPALCLDCHDAKDAALVKAHNGQPFATTNCVSCHNPHQSDEPKLMQAFTHVPFAGGGCDTCHKPAKDGKVVLVAADSRTLCLTCHDEKGKQIESAKVQHPGAQGDCTACHNPHAGKTPGFLQPDPVAACTACHSDIAEQHQKHFPHQPAFTQGCATCHEPHGGENDHLLRAKATNDLCLACHGSDRNPQKVEGQATLTIFDGKVKLPADYFAKVVTLELRYGKGHPVMGHPTSGVLRGTDPKAPQGTLTCLSCHQPHASAQPNLLVKDQANSRKFCETCHTAQEFMNH